jgi:hypothetical protein
MNFCEAGIDCAQKMADYLGADVFMVEDVHIELVAKAKNFPVLAELLKDWPPSAPLQLPPHVKTKVVDILKYNKSGRLHTNEDRGETATVLYAENHLTEQGEKFDMLMDDRGGKALAKDRGLACIDTPTLVVEMVCHGNLSVREGERVWRKTLTMSGAHKGYLPRLEAECPNLFKSRLSRNDIQ